MRRLEAKGTTIAYARTGAGPPIVRMRGAEADHSMFARLSTQRDSRRTVIVCDQRDSGDTGDPGAAPHAAQASILKGVGYVDAISAPAEGPRNHSILGTGMKSIN